MKTASLSLTKMTQPRTIKRDEGKMKTVFSSMCAMAALVAVLWVSPVQAAGTADVTVTVTLSGVSVNVTSGGLVAFGTVGTPLALGSTTVSGTAIVVNNDGEGTETYSLSLTSATTPAGWTVGNPANLNEYQLSAMFSTAAPGATFGAEDVLTTIPTACTATDFGNGTAGQSGASVLTTANRNLWLQLEAPATSTTLAQRSITVTITAGS